MEYKSHNFNTRQFTYDIENKIFFAKMSDLGIPSIDKALKGILIQSDVTGHIVQFIKKYALMKEDTFMGWIYRATIESLDNYPGLFGVEIHIVDE
jgi:hypothetical protein